MRRLVLGLWVALVGCGPIDVEGPADAGRVCFGDSDCVPDGCCGLGEGSVHRLDGPDCSAARCDGACPEDEVRCGCGLAICRGGQCVVAVSTEPRCL